MESKWERSIEIKSLYEGSEMTVAVIGNNVMTLFYPTECFDRKATKIVKMKKRHCSCLKK
jgi:hypothetical protein